ncbi:MAG TPA: carboxypeptidase-like regulatory domain-containing protein [Pirellulales bacterium]|nr:carboxypeptidase-like regulatory domain-containing protein [Pirellulales bacterium]
MSLTALALLAASIGTVADDVPAVTGTVVDEKGQPVAGAEVYLFDGPPIGRTALFGVGSKTRQPPAIFGRTRTNGNGEFEIALPIELPPPRVRGISWLAIAIHKPGLAVQTRLIDRRWPARAAAIRVMLIPPRRNRVRVRSPGDEPVAHARLGTDQIDGVPLPTELSEQLATETNDLGEAELRDVTGEALRIIRVDSPQFGAQWAALARSSDGEASVASLSPVGTISGQLVDDGGAALSSTRVRLATWVDSRDEQSGGGIADVTTDADGQFCVPAIAAGVLQMTAELPADSPLVSTYQGTQQIDFDRQNEVVIRFRHGIHVRGTVIDQADKSPIAGAIVFVDYYSEFRFMECDEAGQYSGYVLPGGLAHLTFASLPREYYTPDPIIPNEPLPEDAEELTFKPLPATAGTTLYGRVVDAQGSPVADAEVVGTCFWSAIGDRTILARSDRDGIFMLPGVPKNATIKVAAYSLAGITKNLVVSSTDDPDPVTVTVDPDSALSISGRAVDESGRPISGAVVRVFPIHFDPSRRSHEGGFVAFGGTERLSTDADGRFTTPKQLRPDRGYRVEVDALGMTPVRTEPFESAASHGIDFGDIVLTPTPRLRTIAGQVVDGSGKAVAGALVRQAGDGPRRTRAICDAEGRFRIGGVYEGPAWLLLSHEGHDVQAQRIDGDARELRLVLRHAPVTAATGDEQMESAESKVEETVVRELFAEHRGRFERGSPSDVQWAAKIEYQFEGRLPKQGAPDFVSGARLGPGYRIWTHDQATELAQATDDMYLRGSFYLTAFDAIGATPDQQRQALAEALLASRAIDEPAIRVPMLGEIGERFFDLGDEEVGTALVREASEQLRRLTAADVPNLAVWQARFAPALAHIDAPAAFALVENARRPMRDWYLADISRSLATENPAGAEEALQSMAMDNQRYHYGAGTVHRMASVDPDRAERIAQKFSLITSRAYGLGLVADAQAGADPDRASKRIEEAYALLEQSLDEGTAGTQYSTCGTAAALLVMVERVNPAMLEHYLARALAMRPPQPARGDPGAWYESEIAQMALAIVPYDRQTARALLEPLAPRIRTLSSVGEQYPGQIWTAFALVDPAWARQLVNSLPEAPPEATISPRATAVKHVIDALAHRGSSRWPWVYQRFLHARHPDTPVRAR